MKESTTSPLYATSQTPATRKSQVIRQPDRNRRIRLVQARRQSRTRGAAGGFFRAGEGLAIDSDQPAILNDTFPGAHGVAISGVFATTDASAGVSPQRLPRTSAQASRPTSPQVPCQPRRKGHCPASSQARLRASPRSGSPDICAGVSPDVSAGTLSAAPERPLPCVSAGTSAGVSPQVSPQGAPPDTFPCLAGRLPARRPAPRPPRFPVVVPYIAPAQPGSTANHALTRQRVHA